MKLADYLDRQKVKITGFARVENELPSSYSEKYSPNEIIPDKYLNPFSNNGDEGSKCLKNLIRGVPLTEIFQNQKIKSMCLSPEKLKGKYGNEKVNFIDKLVIKKPRIYPAVKGMVIYNYGLGQARDNPYLPALERFKSNFSLVRIVGLDKNKDPLVTSFFPIFDFLYFQKYQAWPLLYFTAYNENNNSSASVIIMLNPLLNWCYYIVYSYLDSNWRHPIIEKLGNLPGNVLYSLVHEKQLTDILSARINNYNIYYGQFSNLQIPHWHYGPSSYIYTQNKGNKLLLPTYAELSNCDYEHNYQVFIENESTVVRKPFEPTKPKIYKEFPDEANRASIKFVGNKQEEYFEATGIYLLLGKDKKDLKWIFKVGRANELENRERLYSILAKTKNTHFSANMSVLVIDYFSENELGLRFTKAQYYGVEAIFRNVLTRVTKPKYPSEWFPADTGILWENIINAFERTKEKLIKNKGWLKICDLIGYKKIAGYVRSHLDEFVSDDLIFSLTRF